MFARTHHLVAPWTIVRADDKKVARIHLIKDILFKIDYKHKDESLVLPDTNIVFNYQESCLHNGLISP
jgi:hypothetical protein